MNLKTEIMIIKTWTEVIFQLPDDGTNAKYTTQIQFSAWCILYKKDLIWDEILLFLHIKETELLDISKLKNETVHYTSRNSCRYFQGWGSYWDGPKGGPSAQSGI